VRISNPLLPADDSAAERGSGDSSRIALPAVRVFAVALGVLLLGYMFLGRGFAHLGFPPAFVGEIVLAIGIVATGFALWRNGIRAAPSRIVWLLLGLMVLGAIRTVPYLGEYGLDALRDATLWGYGLFALMVFALADRELVLRAFRLFGWVVPIFVLWLPISYATFAFLSGNVDPNVQGTSVPLIFFKGGDMAVHMVGAIAFLVLGARTVRSPRSVLTGVIIGVPIVWTALVAGAANRGALLTLVLGVAVVVALAPRSRNWIPLLLATVLLAAGLTVQGVLVDAGTAPTTPPASLPPIASGSPSPSPTLRPGASPSGSPDATESGRPNPTASTGPTESPAAETPTPDPSGVERVRVANSDFELGPLNSGVEGWVPFGVGTYKIVGEGGYRDTRFAEVNNTGGPYKARMTSSKFPFTAGEDIEVSLWAKAIRGSPTVEIYVNWYDRSGQRISSVFIGALATGGARLWQEGVGAYTAPSGTTDAEVLLWEAAGNATVGIDHVAVAPLASPAAETPTPDPSGVERVRVANSDFELGPLNSGVEGWVPFGVGTYKIVGEGGYRDTRFAEVNNTGGPYKARMTSSKFPFTAGEDIEVSLWAKAIRGSPTVEIYVNWYDRSGQRISSVFIGALATGGARLWQEGVGAYTAPSGTTDAEVLLWEAAGNATVGIDHVAVRKGDFVLEPPSVRPPKARPATLGQLIENILSVFGSSSDQGLEGTKQFRLAWWGTIVDYTVFGEYFWTGKGFGVNLADADGFQSTLDHSLRAPHNSHVTVLARMGVPGFVLWLVLQAAFGIGLLRATWASRRTGDLRLAAVSGWLLAYWFAMMLDTSFDPYLEGPQGGIWFWTVFGLGLVVMRLGSRRHAA
jgi:hypothetical protein